MDRSKVGIVGDLSTGAGPNPLDRGTSSQEAVEELDAHGNFVSTTDGPGMGQGMRRPHPAHSFGPGNGT